MKHLPKWKTYQNKHKGKETALALGFSEQEHIEGNLTRVDARYSVAKSFQKVVLDDYAPSTVEGYSALMRAFLVYSALESYVRVLNPKSKKICKKALMISDTERVRKLSETILKLDNKRKFYQFILDFSDKKYMKEDLKSFYEGKEHNPVCLLASIRHIFVHGYLTPSVNGTTPKKVKKICDLLSDFFLEQIENDFRKRVMSLKKERK
jgi:hypothetical protein